MFRPAHIQLMPRPISSTPPPDLFGYISSAPAAQKLVNRPPARAPASPHHLTELSDSDLARWAGELVQELERRLAAGQGRKPRPHLDQVVEEAAVVLERLRPRG